jgi:acetoin utilization deacetylase AcuC-like enzyme
MKTIYTKDHLLHDVPFELLSTGLVPCFEKPARAEAVIDLIASAQFGDILAPVEHGLEPVLKVHSPPYVSFLEQAWQLWEESYGADNNAMPYCFPNRSSLTQVPEHIHGKLGYYSFDLSAAITPGTWEAVRASANTALTGVDLILEGETAAFSLCRPPGHHASTDLMGGYCYLNNTAIAAQYLCDHGADRVAILDVDYHHGNGTQQIFYHRGDVLFASIHANPATDYPYFLGYANETGIGEGTDCNHNFPLPQGAGWSTYSEALDVACDRVENFAPDTLVISLGLDTFEADPISSFQLTGEDYQRLGLRIARLGCPTLIVLEGGYALDDLGPNVVKVLSAF